MLPKDFVAGPVGTTDRVIAFCGHCPFFDVWALGGGGDCHKGHDCVERATVGHCSDKREMSRSSGPLFDLSE